MHPLVQNKLPEIAELCRRYHVRRLDLFGSAAGDRFDPERSDIDFVVEYLPEAAKGFGGDYFALKEALETLFNRNVDLVSFKAIRNPYFLEEVEETRVGIYAA
jgi:hypothetical protein